MTRRVMMAATAMMMLTTPVAAETVTVTMTGEPTDEDQRLVKAALVELLTACPALTDTDRFTRIEARAPAEPYPFMNERYGWTRMVYVTANREDGHVVHLVAGGGGQPGVLVRKRESQEACGLPLRDGDTFMPLDSMGLLDDGAYELPY